MKKLVLVVFLIFGLCVSQNAWANFSSTEEDSPAYRLALLNERSLHPDKVLLKRNVEPTDAAVQEFVWILETLRNRCQNSELVLVQTMVQTWREVQRRGYTPTLLAIGREISSFASIASKEAGNSKVDVLKVAGKWLKQKYPLK